jgi:hypothetical protein
VIGDREPEFMNGNPDAKYLGEADAVAVIESTAVKLAEALREIGPERNAAAPRLGKWSAREILCHLADCEIVPAGRLGEKVHRLCGGGRLARIRGRTGVESRADPLRFSGRASEDARLIRSAER